MSFFIRPPLRVKRLIFSFLLLSSLLLTPFFFKLFYNNSPNLSATDAVLDETLRHIMIRNHGIYTLFGSKPITMFWDGDGEVDREKEMKEFLQFSKQFQKKYRRIKSKEYRTLPKHLKKKYSKQDVFFSDYQWNDLWEFWEKHWVEYTGKRYFFVFAEDAGLTSLFVNVNEVLYYLYHYYDDFRKLIGKDFSPEQVLQELRQEISEFWEKVFCSPYLTGLLLGYGEKSSRLFELESNQKISELSYVMDLKRNGWNIHRAHLRVSDLATPEFKVFSLYDEQISIFQRERDRIIDFYSKENFLQKTLSILKQDDHILIDAISGKLIPTRSH